MSNPYSVHLHTEYNPQKGKVIWVFLIPTALVVVWWLGILDILSSVYWMVMCGNLMVIGTDTILKLKILIAWTSPWILVGLLNYNTRFLQSATSLHMLYCIHICVSWRASECNLANPPGISQGKIWSTAQSLHRALSAWSICAYIKRGWAAKKKKKNGNKGTNMYFPRLQLANINWVWSAPWLPMYFTHYLWRLWQDFNLSVTISDW